MRMKMICAAAGLLSVGFAAPGASASYMEECKAFISEWEVCLASGGDCSKEEDVIETECRCHEKKGDEWKLVMAVASDGVCDATYDDPPDIPVTPPPHSPPPRDIIDQTPSDPGERPAPRQ